MKIHLTGKSNAGKNSRKGWMKPLGTILVNDQVRGGALDAVSAPKPATPQSFRLKRKSKYVPKGIDPAFPQKNFVKAHYENKGDANGFYEDMFSFDSMAKRSEGKIKQIPSRYRQEKSRLGDLRLSGSPKAHRIGKR